ncbi:MAG: hypothetical protein ABF586_13535 [Sporolactobacillus sp.]
MNYRQMTTLILANIRQAERNMDGLHERGLEKEITALESHFFTLKFLAGVLADETYDALKTHLKGGETHENA